MVKCPICGKENASQKRLFVWSLIVIFVIVCLGYGIKTIDIPIFGTVVTFEKAAGSASVNSNLIGEWENITRIKIVYVEPEKTYWAINENVNVSFLVVNKINTTYSIQVNWILDKIHPGWNAISINFYNASIIENRYNTWNNLTLAGNWTVQIILNYSINRNNYIDEKITHLQVLKIS